MSCSSKKGPFVDEKLYIKVMTLNERKAKQPIKTWALRTPVMGCAG